MFDVQNPEHRALLRLAMTDGIGPLMRKNLIEYFGSAAAVFNATAREWSFVPGIGDKRAAALNAVTQDMMDKLLEYCDRSGIRLLPLGDSDFPQQLSTIYDPPGILFVRGQLLPADALSLAIVGTRHCSAYGKKTAYTFGYNLGLTGITVVSGLARGVDTESHLGALAAGGRTIAVLAAGVDDIYPPENIDLAQRIIDSGSAVVSESIPGQSASLRGMFPQRNRIISGLTLGTLVVEADMTSGSMITARHANEQNRDVFAIPGQIDSRLSKGCHALIRDGAKLVRSVDDILEDLGPLYKPVTNLQGKLVDTAPNPAEIHLNDLEKRILELVDSIGGNVSIDQLIQQSGLPPQNILSIIIALEARRLIKRTSGQTVTRY